MAIKVFTYTGKYLQPAYPRPVATKHSINLVPNATYPSGTVLGEVTATPGVFKAYVTSAVDGSQIPKCFLIHDCITDATGLITYGTVAGSAGELSTIRKNTPAYYSGPFRVNDLVGLDAGGLTAMGGKLTAGNTVAPGSEVVVYG